ncbi:MAG: hypothetical protein JWN85_451 [Gammaproteobacteria bacterium]|nr:hypothetical protein [Gammaproteobacteria bacterium]
MSDRRIRLVLTLAVLTAGSGFALADDDRKPADPALDAELLEFLGSVDPPADGVQPDDGTWIEYLSQTDIGKVVKTPTVAEAKPAAPAPKPSAPGVKENE